jgi:hypothetical protein
MGKEFETFRNIGNYDINNLTQNSPSVINGDVRIKKYKITIEEIGEPKEIYEQRLQELWDNCDNHHRWNPLRNEAKKLNYELIGNAGNKLKK